MSARERYCIVKMKYGKLTEYFHALIELLNLTSHSQLKTFRQRGN